MCVLVIKQYYSNNVYNERLIVFRWRACHSRHLALVTQGNTTQCFINFAVSIPTHYEYLSLFDYIFVNNRNCFVGLVVPSATADHDVPGSMPGSGVEYLGFSFRKFPVPAQSLWDGDNGKYKQLKGAAVIQEARK